MTETSLEERVAALEAEVAHLKERLGDQAESESREPELPWWEKIVGTFADDPEYDEAMRLGREYRESLRPQDDEAAA